MNRIEISRCTKTNRRCHSAWIAPLKGNSKGGRKQLTKFKVLLFAMVTIFGWNQFSQFSNADVLADGGSIVTHVGGMTGAVAGADRSSISPHTPLATTLGVNMTGQFRVADDFTLDNSVNTINAITIYGYQTNAFSPSIDSLTIRIWMGAPNDGGVVVWGDTSTNLLTSNLFMLGPSGLGVYRENNSGGSTSQTRRIQTAVAGGLDITLSSGTYWLDWAITGGSSFMLQPPVSSASFFPVGNGLQASNSVYAPRVDDGALVQMAFPFTIEGTSVPEPSSLFELSVVAALVLSQRRTRVASS